VAEALYASALNGVREKIALIGVRAAELSLAQQRLQDAVICAPFDGLVQQREVAPGTYVQVGQGIATLVRNSTLRFRGTMPERHAQRLALGCEVRLEIESVAEPRVAAVTRISPALDPLSRALLFEARIDNADGRLRSGLFAEADVVLDADAQSIVVPKSAVLEFAGVEKVWRVVDGVIGEHVVHTGQRRGEGIEIVEGLSAGDQILRNAGEGRVARIDAIPATTDRSIDIQQSAER
jgi:RND family efflux transporter MFP subunit